MTKPVNMSKDIRAFHEKFGLGVEPGEPRMLSKELVDFRIKFMQEELDEYRLACEEGNMVKAFDALIDLGYVLMGTVYLHRFPYGQGWQFVHYCNMMKERVERAEQSKRGSTFDVIKPEGWEGPERALAALLGKSQEYGN